MTYIGNITLLANAAAAASASASIVDTPGFDFVAVALCGAVAQHSGRPSVAMRPGGRIDGAAGITGAIDILSLVPAGSSWFFTGQIDGAGSEISVGAELVGGGIAATVPAAASISARIVVGALGLARATGEGAISGSDMRLAFLATELDAATSTLGVAQIAAPITGKSDGAAGLVGGATRVRFLSAAAGAGAGVSGALAPLSFASGAEAGSGTISTGAVPLLAALGGKLNAAGVISAPAIIRANLIGSPLSASAVTRGDATRLAGSGTGIAIPAAIAGAGMSVVFFDDFTSATTIAAAQNSTDVAPINWFPYGSGTNHENYNLLTTAHAADIGLSDWNRHPTTGQSNASADGGILECLGDNFGGFNDCFQTVPHVLNNGTGRNQFKHGYFEFYIQFNADGKPTQGDWPACWSWSDTGKIEIDFLEYGNGPSFPASTTNTWVFNVWDPGGGGGNHTGGTMYGGATNDSDWHTIACWWKSTGTGVGSLDFYFDNVHKAGPFATGPGTNVPDIENETKGIYLIIGTGVGWPTRWDWVRVWQ